MTLLSVFATLFGTISAFANFPQAYRIFKRRSAKDISIITYLIILIGAITWFLYGLELKNSPLIIANSIGTVSVLLVIIGWFLYGRMNK
jgi:MtN3 and saliva related transmembrane protein